MREIQGVWKFTAPVTTTHKTKNAGVIYVEIMTREIPFISKLLKSGTIYLLMGGYSIVRETSENKND